MGRGTPGEELSDSWAGSSLPCRRALSPTASLRSNNHGIWLGAGFWELGQGSLQLSSFYREKQRNRGPGN